MMTILGRFVLLGCLLASPPALAQSYPDRNVTIVVTSAAGALTDVLTRAVAQRLSQMWNQSIIVENRGGAGHNFAARRRGARRARRLHAARVGNRLRHQPAAPLRQGQAALRSGNRLHPGRGLRRHPGGAAGQSVGAGEIGRRADRARQGKARTITYGTAGVGTALHTAALLLESLTGIKLTAVHYRGAAPALNDLIAGHINMITMGPSVALPAVQDGKLKMLGFGSDKRVAQFPDVPTIAETVPGYEAGVSFGLFAPKGTPREVIIKINADVQKVINDPEFHKRFLEPLVVQPMPGSLDAFAEYLRKDSAKWAKVIKRGKLEDRIATRLASRRAG